MTNEPRRALRSIIAKYGTEICSNSRRCEGLLKDKCGSHRREISILVNALEEHVPLDLLASRNSVPRELLLTRLAKRLEENLALTEDAAIWAVESWALALDIISDAEIAERENKRAKSISQHQAQADFDSVNKSQQPENKNPLPRTSTQRQPPAPKQSSKINPPPVFAPPPQPPKQKNIPVGTQGSQMQAHPSPIGQTFPQSAQKQPPAVQAPGRKRSWKLRSCSIGCFLLLILLGILVVGVPYTIRVMRETQQTSQPPRFPQQ